MGLDLNAGSIAAVELHVNGSGPGRRPRGPAPLAPGSSATARSATATALGTALKELFAENKLSKHGTAWDRESAGRGADTLPSPDPRR